MTGKKGQGFFTKARLRVECRNAYDVFAQWKNLRPLASSNKAMLEDGVLMVWRRTSFSLALLKSPKVRYLNHAKVLSNNMHAKVIYL